eukprot:7214138-Pyramimonas_sp.AAC.1
MYHQVTNLEGKPEASPPSCPVAMALSPVDHPGLGGPLLPYRMQSDDDTTRAAATVAERV